MKKNKKTVFITGGGQGIGKGIAKVMLSYGWNVAIGDIDPEAGLETELEYAGLGSIDFFHQDVRDEQSVRTALKSAVKVFDGLDALINNAGIPEPYAGPIEKCPLKVWNNLLATNLTGVFLCAKHALPYLKKSKGAIVNISSTRALMSEPNTESYSASKGGMLSLTHALAISCGPKVRVNCISPGWIHVSEWKKKTLRKKIVLWPEAQRIHPVGRIGMPEDIGEMVAFLVSERAGFITGQNFNVDGGMTKKMTFAE